MPFDDLPLDIHTSICLYLDGPDILALGQTCTALRTATQEKAVWIDALEQAIIKNQIFAGIPPKYRNMDLDLLKDEATGPFRVLAKLRNNGGPTDHSSPHILNYTNNRIIRAECLTDDTSGDGKYFSRLCLIPGGRFLIAYSPQHVHLYDLGTDIGAQTEADGLIRIPYDESWLFMPSPSPDGKEIRLAIAQTIQSCGRQVAEVSVMRFIIDQPTLPPRVEQKTTTLEVADASDPDFFTVVHDLLIYTYTNIVGATKTCILNVWNFMENTFASWQVGDTNALELFYDSGHIVVIEENVLRGWRIPPLRPRRHDEPIPIQDIPATFTIPFNTSTSVSGSSSHSSPDCERIYDWYNTHNPLDVFQFKTVDDGFHVWTTFIIQSQSLATSSPASADLANPLNKVIVEYPTKSRFRRLPLSFGDVVTNPSFICNDSVVRLFASRGRPFAAVMSPFFDAGTTESIEAETMVELQTLADKPLGHSLYSRVHIAFDPFSGRLAYISKNQDSIVVLDYLNHPGVDHEVHAPPESPSELGSSSGQEE